VLAKSGSCSIIACETSPLRWAKSHGEFASSDVAAAPRSAKSRLRWNHLGWTTSNAIIGGTKIDRPVGMVEPNTQDRISANILVRRTLGGVAGISVGSARRFARGELNGDRVDERHKNYLFAKLMKRVGKWKPREAYSKNVGDR